MTVRSKNICTTCSILQIVKKNLKTAIFQDITSKKTSYKARYGHIDEVAI